jgi:pilus assembly protein CpaF
MRNTDSSPHGKKIGFPQLLTRIQEFMPNAYSELMASSENSSQRKFQIVSRIKKFLNDNRYYVEGLTTEALTEKLYNDMAGFSFLTKYLTFQKKGVEGIEIDSWDSVKIKHVGGVYERSKEYFLSPQHALDVAKRILNQSGITMDEAQPLARGHIGDRIRITVNGGGGTLDKNVGIALSIRFINPNDLTAEQIIQSGTLTKEMLDFLCNCYRYGVSMLLAGETDAGKTTLMSVILKISVPFEKKLITIENGDREFNCIVRDKETGDILNSVIHEVTKESKDPKLAIGQQELLEHAMTMNPDFLCMAEIKGSEAFETIEAALTGHPVIGTIHVDCCEDIPDRLVQLASLKKSNLSDATLYKMIAKAFPILFFCQKGEDGVRRVTEICECCLENDRPSVHTLWEYVVTENRIVDGKRKIGGYYKKTGCISETLQKKLRRKQMPLEILQKIISVKGGKPGNEISQSNFLSRRDGRNTDSSENVAV